MQSFPCNAEEELSAWTICNSLYDASDLYLRTSESTPHLTRLIFTWGGVMHHPCCEQILGRHRSASTPHSAAVLQEAFAYRSGTWQQLWKAPCNAHTLPSQAAMP